MKKENVRKYIGLMNDEIKAMEKDFNCENIRESWEKANGLLLGPGIARLTKAC